MNLRIGGLLLIALLGGLAAAPGAASGSAEKPPPAPTYVTAAVTPDGSDTYRYEPRGTAMAVVAPRSNRGVNLREVWWAGRFRPVLDQQTCATWSRFGGPIAQAGLALRVTGRTGDLRLLTVTNNIWSGARAGWNVHLWRTGTDQHRIIGQVRLARVFGALPVDEPALPWRVCARAVGRALELKAWPLSDPRGEPSWGDPAYGITLQLPPDWVHPGTAGWYVGHLRPGERMGYEDLVARPVTLEAGDSMAVRLRSVTSTLYGNVVGPAVGGVGRLGAPLPPRVTEAS